MTTRHGSWNRYGLCLRTLVRRRRRPKKGCRVWVVLGVCRGSIGITEKKMETTILCRVILGLGLGIWSYIRFEGLRV